jgi:hypothetical protein
MQRPLEETTMTAVENDNTRRRDGFGIDPACHVGSILTDAYLQCVASGIRFAFKTTSILAKGQIAFLNQIRFPNAHEFPEQLRTVVDEARGCLREVADVASLELAQLRSRIGALEEATRSLVPDVNDSDHPYRRRWKAKL